MTATLDLDAIVQAAAGIPGWMEPEELRWLAETAATRSRIAEVGSWQGRSTKALAMATTGFVYAIDDWRGEPDRPMSGGELARAFTRNLWPELLNCTVIHFNRPSAEMALACARRGVRFDLVFLDGDHAAEAVRADISHWLPLLASGGLLAGHDVRLTGVAEALADVLPTARHLTHAGSIWEWVAP